MALAKFQREFAIIPAFKIEKLDAADSSYSDTIEAVDDGLYIHEKGHYHGYSTVGERVDGSIPFSNRNA